MNEFGIPNKALYCQQCCKTTEHHPKVTLSANGALGGSWHYHCSQCGYRYFHALPKIRQSKRMQLQIKSWIESEEKRIREEKLLRAFNL